MVVGQAVVVEIIDGVFPKITNAYFRYECIAYGISYGETPVALVEHQVVFECPILSIHTANEVN